MQEKKQTVQEFVQNHFQVDNLIGESNDANVYQRNMPQYATILNNF
jgi:hypothetical protein